MISTRAITSSQKEHRRSQLITVARKLYDTKGFDAIRMAEVATLTGLAKGSTYSYFASKEELFLAVLVEDLGAWFAVLNRLLTEVESTLAPAGAARLITTSFTGHERLLRMVCIVHTVLEQNLPEAAIVAYKHFMLEQVQRTALLLQTRLSDLRPGKEVELLLGLNALVIGVGHLARPAPTVQQVLQREEFQLFRVEFYTLLEQLLTQLITGYTTTTNFNS